MTALHPLLFTRICVTLIHSQLCKMQQMYLQYQQQSLWQSLLTTTVLYPSINSEWQLRHQKTVSYLMFWISFIMWQYSWTLWLESRETIGGWHAAKESNPSCCKGLSICTWGTRSTEQAIRAPPVYWVLRARPYQPSALTACSFVENQCPARGIFLNTMLFQYFCFDGHKDSKSSTQTGLILNEMYKMWHLFSWFASKWQFTTIT